MGKKGHSVTWVSVIQQAARHRFARNGDCGPFLLKRVDLAALVVEISGVSLNVAEWGQYIRVQAQVPVPDLKMCICVDEWVDERKPCPSKTKSAAPA